MARNDSARTSRVMAIFAARIAATWLTATAAIAAPYVPTDDAQVLERLPGGTAAQLRQLKSMQAARAAAPNDLSRATELATANIRASRVEGDPRFLGYAQAALAPWWKDPAAPTAVLLLRATILQSSHQFEPALADLARVLEREPKHAQALLTRATVLTVMGRYREARADRMPPCPNRRSRSWFAPTSAHPTRPSRAAWRGDRSRSITASKIG